MTARSGDRIMRSQFVPRLLAYVARRGGDIEPLARRYALPSDVMTLDEVALPLRDLWALSEDAADSIRDPNAGLHVALELEHGGYGALELATRASPTLGDALALLIRFSTMMNAVTVFSMQAIGERVLITHRIPGEPRCVGRHGNDYSIAGLLVIARRLAGPDVALRRAWFAHPQPADTRELETYFGEATIDFDAGSNGVEVDTALLARPLPTADPVLERVLEKEVLQKHVGVTDLLGEVRKHIGAMLPKTCTIQAVAKRMRLTPRTLQRRLADESVSFQDALDEVRHLRACHDLLNASASLGEISHELGYSELSAFVRAFRRWEGITPAQFRERARR